MKFITLFLTFTASIAFAFGQDLDESIKNVSNELAVKLSKKHLTNIGIIDFVNENNKQDRIAAYLQEQVELNLINSADLQIIDRKHIFDLLRENKLVSQGLIDESTIKRAVSFIKVENWVVAEIADFGDIIKLKLKVINVTTSRMLAASIVSLDAGELKKLFEPKLCYLCKGAGTTKIFTQCNNCSGKGLIVCSICKGDGRDYISGGLGGDPYCKSCKGKGKVECPDCHGTKQMVSSFTCAKCNGSGIHM